VPSNQSSKHLPETRHAKLIGCYRVDLALLSCTVMHMYNVNLHVATRRGDGVLDASVDISAPISLAPFARARYPGCDSEAIQGCGCLMVLEPQSFSP
jgi:hypothetical protein